MLLIEFEPKFWLALAPPHKKVEKPLPEITKRRQMLLNVMTNADTRAEYPNIADTTVLFDTLHTFLDPRMFLQLVTAQKLIFTIPVYPKPEIKMEEIVCWKQYNMETNAYHFTHNGIEKMLNDHGWHILYKEEEAIEDSYFFVVSKTAPVTFRIRKTI